MPRAKRQESYREAMFRKAWKLDLAGDTNRFEARSVLQDQLCNAIAYYMVLYSAVASGRARTGQVRLGGRVDQSFDVNKTDEAIVARMSDSNLLRTCDDTITSEAKKLIIRHFEGGEDRKVVGLAVSLGRLDPNSAGLAFQIRVRLAAEGLFKIFSQKPSEHGFHAAFVHSESLGLVLKSRHRVTKKSAQGARTI